MIVGYIVVSKISTQYQKNAEKKQSIMKQLRYNLLLILAAAIWGAAFLAQQTSTGFVGAFTFNGTRFLIGGIVLLPVVLLSDKKFRQTAEKEKKPVPTPKNYASVGILCGIVLAAASSFQQKGFEYNTSAGKAAFITALYVIIVPMLERLLGKKTSFFLWISAFLAIIGMALLTLGGESSITVGDILEIICAVLFSVHILVIDRTTGNLNGVKISCIQFFTAGVICTIIALISETISLQALLDCKGCILYAGVFSCGVAYTLQIVGQKKTKPVIASLLLSLESVFAALFENLLTLFGLYNGKIMKPLEITGCCIVFAAIILAQLPVKASD